jgi:hypothetical protein
MPAQKNTERIKQMTTRMERLEQSLINEHGWRVVHINEWRTEALIHGTYLFNALHITAVVSVQQSAEDIMIIPRTYFHEPPVEDWQSYGIAEDMLKVLVSELVKLGNTEIYVTHFQGGK